METVESSSLKPRSRSLTPLSDGVKGSPTSGGSRNSLKREHEEDDGSECELEIADGGRMGFKGSFNEGAVNNSDPEVRVTIVERRFSKLTDLHQCMNF